MVSFSFFFFWHNENLRVIRKKVTKFKETLLHTKFTLWECCGMGFCDLWKKLIDLFEFGHFCRYPCVELERMASVSAFWFYQGLFFIFLVTYMNFLFFIIILILNLNLKMIILFIFYFIWVYGRQRISRRSFCRWLCCWEAIFELFEGLFIHVIHTLFFN